MADTINSAPTAAQMEAMALAALARLPTAFAAELGDLVLVVQEFAEAEVLAGLGIDDPFHLTGVYEGVPLTERSVEHSGTLPPRVRLFRRPILEEWAARGNESLEHLVAHVVIHEIGHHFGLSDEDMHALESQVR